MKHFKVFYLLLVLTVISCKRETTPKTLTETHTDLNGFTYETVINDPTGLRLYTLDNGMKVYLSRNTDEPKIQTFIPVRTGSIYDPSDNTGLAHYLEHMVFKGTDEIGTQDWDKEQVLLGQISDLFEMHKAETDSIKKTAIYRKIDSVSYVASKLTIANEYDKMISSLGAEEANAWTSDEETVYLCEIPSNELDKWLKLESERFSQLVLRLFHTELEAVYEEFNMGQDDDSERALYALLENLFPKHPYGQKTVIGTSKHLKNPSMVSLHDYFEKYYVPNNMAVILVGDIEFDKTIKKINDAFGNYKRREITFPERPTEEPITTVIEKDVYGPEEEGVSLAFRSEGVGSNEEKYLTLINMILNNSEAGLIDVNLNQKQQVQQAGCYTYFLNDYGMHTFYGQPKSNQTLEEVKNLIIAQIEEFKKGNFDEWMLEAVINDMKLSQINQYENTTAVAFAYVNAFIHYQNWEDQVKQLDELRKISKQELVDFANKFYRDNYVVVYKRQGKAKNIVKVRNPEITPIELNRDKQSEFNKKFNEIGVQEIQPQTVNFHKAINKKQTQNGIEVSYIENKVNDLASLYFIFDMGSDNDKKLKHVVGYAEYLGTDTYSPEELKKEFYKLGVNYGVSISSDKLHVYLSGLSENLDKGLKLLEHLWTNAIANQETYNKYVQNIGKQREDGKTDKENILFNGLKNYSLFGESSRLRDIYTMQELKDLDPNDLVATFKNLKNYKQRLFYYGNDIENVITSVEINHSIPKTLKAHPPKKIYKEKETGGNVYFVDYDMVQTEMLFVSKGEVFHPDNLAASALFNSYFGNGLSSIVFQEIRESKSLAYSAYADYSIAEEKDKPNYLTAYIGTQANKMHEAVDAMMELMTNMPYAEKQFEAAKESILKILAAHRINKAGVFWEYERLKKRGSSEDMRKKMYNQIKQMSFKDLQKFFNENIKGKDYDILVIGNKKDVDMSTLKKLGEIKEMDVDYLFNYE
ncbi:M16 family metallopeptidase [Aestuariivivens insulae]|uniref:M16 family metallopeptidase n=1 Tax=Aestuariivivens insulae TaxID=1621988 RepID=UPI001F59A898|nr:M16 family metallopeptidase [Aestuariivivens insulae]